MPRLKQREFVHRSRRTTSPVRVALSSDRGGDIDGAWWPRSISIARELPELIQALHPSLGDIVDIDINWSASSPTPTLSTMSTSVVTSIGVAKPRLRLMFLTGQCALTKLLVVPSLTPPPLALMVLRQAAARGIPDAAEANKDFQAAKQVLHAARSESSAWAATRAAQPAVRHAASSTDRHS